MGSGDVYKRQALYSVIGILRQPRLSLLIHTPPSETQLQDSLILLPLSSILQQPEITELHNGDTHAGVGGTIMTCMKGMLSVTELPQQEWSMQAQNGCYGTKYVSSIIPPPIGGFAHQWTPPGPDPLLISIFSEYSS